MQADLLCAASLTINSPYTDIKIAFVQGWIRNLNEVVPGQRGREGH